MNKQSAINLVKSTFENPYDRDRFLNFSRNLLHSFEPATFIYRGNYIPDAYKKQIKTLERLGKFEDRDKNKIDILAVCLNQGSTLERARTLQRNFISWYLNGSRGDVTKDAALVAFYVEGSQDWRLSLVKMEYRLGKSDAGRLKTFTELTPAKRFSFLVGENENTHTAQKQLLPTLIKEDAPPTLSDLEKVFSVEVVTKEFFEKYKQLFLETKEALDKIVKADSQIENDFKDKNIDTVDFTKKLLGQIVFLYFLQKKGWFGVARDENWGSGPKEFLRLLFEKNVIDYENYFNDILEPLFYEALAIERPDDFYSRFDCKIPFLNGGLFDPLNNYDWVHTDIRLPNHLFSNDKLTKEGDHGTGILDVFDRYNFTVKEDEPLEREVAVDPEMLGKVFENLLEVKDRKSKGTYYTPREIVHYMCQESLVNYLATELEGKARKEDVETLVQIGEAAVEHDTRVTEIGEETDTYSYKLPESIRNNAKQIDDALASIHVCDPAVGSGAFLVGMMTEIIRVRNTISSYFVDGDRSIYAFKHHAIQHSLYGVDIDPGATEIAKLRLWLSLIVDEQDIKKIKPLPNLDYKIMQGNSLLEEFEGIKLFDEELFTKSVFDNTAQIESLKAKISELSREFVQLYQKGEFTGIKKQQIEAELQKNNKALKKLTDRPKPTIENTGLFDQESEAKEKAKDLKRLQKEFFNTSHKKEKDQIKKRIESLTWELIEATLREQGKESLMTQVEKYKKANIRPFFLWKLNYSEVFESKGGFDVIIANPPYVKEYVNKSAFDGLRGSPYYQGKMDLWYFFACLGIDLLKNDGVLCFIAQNNWVTSFGASKMRKKVATGSQIISLIDFANYKIFEAGIQTGIMMFKKNIQSDSYTFDYRKLRGDSLAIDDVTALLNKENNDKSEYLTPIFDRKEFTNKKFTFSDDDTEKVLQIISTKSNFQLDPIKEVAQGIVCPQDSVNKASKKKLGDNVKVGDGIFILSNSELNNLGLSANERSIVKPLYTTEELKRWWGNTKNKKWVIYTDSSFKSGKINDYPSIKNHLDKFRKVITSDNKPYGLHRARNEYFFRGEKIIAVRKCLVPTFTYADFDSYVTATFYVIKTERLNLKYLLALLNSKPIAFWLRHKEKMQGNNYQIDKEPLVNLPIYVADQITQGKIAAITDKAINAAKTGHQNDLLKYELELNKSFYELYGLKPEEVAIVEGGQNG